MIKIGEQIKIEFGEGDIRIISSATTDGEVGYLALDNQTPPRPIGKNTEKEKTPFDPSNYPIVMNFTKTESIDALIGELLNAKRNMMLDFKERMTYEIEYTTDPLMGANVVNKKRRERKLYIDESDMLIDLAKMKRDVMTTIHGVYSYNLLVANEYNVMKGDSR